MIPMFLAEGRLLALWQRTRHWVHQHGELVLWGGVASAVLCVAGMLALPLIATRLPDDYLVRLGEGRAADESPRHWLKTLGRNAAGIALLLTGIVLLPLPGPGLLVLIVGLGFTDFPAKRRVLLHLVRQPSVLGPLNWLRRRAGKPALRLPRTDPR